MDVRRDKIGRLNRVICWSFNSTLGYPLAFVFRFLLHIELPRNVGVVRLPHPYGVVVNPGATIGKNVTIYQGVTIGGKRLGKNAGVPFIEDDVILFPNSVVVGRVHVGKGAVVAPCSVVISDVPANDVVSGNPARTL